MERRKPILVQVASDPQVSRNSSKKLFRNRSHSNQKFCALVPVRYGKISLIKTPIKGSDYGNIEMKTIIKFFKKVDCLGIAAWFKYIIGGFAALIIIGLSTFNFILNNDEGSRKFSNLTLANLVALSQENSENTVKTFTFNGITWTNAKQWYNILGKEYTPVQINCKVEKTTNKVTVGASATVAGYGASASVSVGGNTKTSWDGEMVQCQGGNGNCRNGTDCKGKSNM